MRIIVKSGIHFLLKLSLVSVFLLIIVTACSETNDNPILAKFDGGVVLRNEYVNHFLLSTQYKPEALPGKNKLKEIVFLKAMEKMAILEANNRDLDSDSSYQYLKMRNERRTLFYKYMREEIINSVITDSLLHVFHKNFSPQYHISYIIRPVVKTSTKEFEQSQKDTIEVVYGLLKAGHKLEDLAKRFSQDITTNQKGGSLGFVIRESMGDAMIRTVMDTLKDFACSKPFRGYEGYYILYKGEQREVPVPPFEKLKNKMWKTLYRTRRHDIQRTLDARFESLVKQKKYRVNEKVVNALKIKAGGSKQTSDFTMLNFSKLSAADLAQVVARYKTGQIKASELFDDPKKAPDNMVEFNERLTLMAQQHLLSQHARELGYENIPAIRTQLKEINESLLRSSLFIKAVKNPTKAKVDSVRTHASGTMEAEQLKSHLTKIRFQYERELKQNFEDELQTKYKFQFVEENFHAALKAAEAKKAEQVEQTQGK